METYREIEWKNISDLTKKLGKSHSSYYVFQKSHPGGTMHDYVDLMLGDCTYSEYVSRGYVGGTKYRDIIWNTSEELSELLGREKVAVNRWVVRVSQNNGIEAQKEYIDMKLKDNTYEEYIAQGYRGVYRCCGVEWSEQKELADKLGVSPTQIVNWKRINNKNDKDYLVMKLNGMTYEDYVANGYKSYKQYRGIKWNSRKELADMLKRSYCSINYWITMNKTKEEDYIDLLLKDCTYEEYVENGYEGCFKYCDFSWNTKKELAEKLNIPLRTMTYWLSKNSGKTERDYIDYYLQKKGVRVS